MSAHAIFAIGGNESGKTVYCTCGANIHEPSNTPMLSAWSKHVEQAVREEVMREAGLTNRARARGGRPMSDRENLCAIIHCGIGLNFKDLAEEIIAAGFHRDRIIDTESDLTVADYGAVIMDAEGLICEVDDSWLSGHICLDILGQDERICGDEITWPVTVIKEPEENES